MKTLLRRISAVVLAVLMVLGMTAVASAAEGSVTYEGGGTFTFGPGSDLSDTDLFPDIKSVMPGDEREQTVTVTNNSSETDFVNIYLRAEAHDETSNPLETDVKETETVATMTDFLSQLSMKVYNGDELIYEASPDQTDGLTEPVLLGKFAKGDTATLKVVLTVPADLGNEYANRRGEVDWVFTVEEFNDGPSIDVEVEVTNEPEDGDAYKEGEEVDYEIVVTNDGDTPLVDVVVTDPLTGDEWTIPELAPGESVTLIPQPYVVTEEDAENGFIDNPVTATGTADNPDHTQVSDEDSVTVPTKVAQPALAVSKTVTSKPRNKNGYQKDEKVTYQIEVRNSGNVPVYNVKVTDPLTGDEWDIPKLEIGESQTFTATYTVTADDVKAKSVKNVVTAEGDTDPDNPDNPDDPTNDDEVDVPTYEPDIPPTGDNTNILPWIILLGVGLVGGAGALFFVFKKRKTEE